MKSRRKAVFDDGVTVPEDELGCAELVYLITGNPINQWCCPGKSVEIVLEMLSTLSEEEYRVVAMRFGIGTKESWKSPREIGLSFGIPKLHAQNILSGALRKLRHPQRKNPLLFSLIGFVGFVEEKRAWASTPYEPIDYNQIPILVEDAKTFLNQKAIRAFKKAGKDIRFVGELISFSEEDFLKIPGIGKKTLEYVRDRLLFVELTFGYSLGEQFRDLCAKRKAEASK